MTNQNRPTFLALSTLLVVVVTSVVGYTTVSSRSPLRRAAPVLFQPQTCRRLPTSLTTTATPSIVVTNDNENNNNNNNIIVEEEEHLSRVLASSSIPSWEELASGLAEGVVENNDNDNDKSKKTIPPLVTLYRDTNGWCPFCERVWLALRAKGIPFEEELISLQNKPNWYKTLVPSSKVPAVLFHQELEGDTTHERWIVWESMDILRELDEVFPDTPQLLVPFEQDPKFQQAMKLNEELVAAGFAYASGNRNETLTDAEKEELRMKFTTQLDRLEDALQAVQQKYKGKKASCFRMGPRFTAIDTIMIPTLERWRYQLPITLNLDITQNRPALQQWFAAMDSFPAYSHRVAGDEYSWTATTSQFLRFFSQNQTDPKVIHAIARADAAAERLEQHSFTQVNDESIDTKFFQEAVTKLINNHEAIVNDCTNTDPKSQKHIPRATGPVAAADAVLRHVTAMLLLFAQLPDNDPFFESMLQQETLRTTGDLPIVFNEKKTMQAGIVAARTVASRLCVPRDMSAPAAQLLRAVLTTVANELENDMKKKHPEEKTNKKQGKVQPVVNEKKATSSYL